MFNINYHGLTGDIVSYQETPPGVAPDAGHNNVPPECETLSFHSLVPGLTRENGQLVMKVDVTTKKLVLLKPVEIPEPIQNPDNAAA